MKAFALLAYIFSMAMVVLLTVGVLTSCSDNGTSQVPHDPLAVSVPDDTGWKPGLGMSYSGGLGLQIAPGLVLDFNGGIKPGFGF